MRTKQWRADGIYSVKEKVNAERVCVKKKVVPNIYEQKT